MATRGARSSSGRGGPVLGSGCLRAPARADRTLRLRGLARGGEALPGARELDALLARERDGEGLAIERSLGLPGWKVERPSDPDLAGKTVGGSERDFRSRFLSLALETYRRSKISRGKLQELGRLVATPETEIDLLLERLGLDRLGFLDDEEDDEILLPGD